MRWEKYRSEELSDKSVIAVRVDEIITDAAANELIAGLIAAASLLKLTEVHIWAVAESLPRLAVAASGIDKLPEAFRLWQIDATAINRESTTT